MPLRSTLNVTRNGPRYRHRQSLICIHSMNRILSSQGNLSVISHICHICHIHTTNYQLVC